MGDPDNIARKKDIMDEGIYEQLIKKSQEIEEIKKLKARYFRLLDEKRWDEWGQLFTEDFTGVYLGPHPEHRYSGRIDIVTRISAGLADALTVHHGHMPEIELLSPTRAIGIWAMDDYLQLPEMKFKGYGHYEDEYFKGDDGKWRIKSTRLTRVRVDMM
jgi:hypothetical protein